MTGVLLPGLAAGAVLAVGWRLWRRDALAAAPAAWAALGVGVAACLGAVLRFGLELPPASSAARLPWVAAAGAAYGALESASAPRWRPLLRAVLIAAALRFVLAYRFGRTWGELEGLARVTGGAALLAFLWWCWERALAELGARAGTILLWLAASATSVMLLCAYSAKLAEHLGAACAGLGALAVAAFLRLQAGVGGALAVVLLLGTACAALAGVQGLAGFHPALFALPPAAPVCVLLARPLWQRRGGALGLVLGVTCGLAPVAAGVAIAWRAYDPLGDY
jgi:hypothetical protein